MYVCSCARVSGYFIYILRAYASRSCILYSSHFTRAFHMMYSMCVSCKYLRTCSRLPRLGGAQLPAIPSLRTRSTPVLKARRNSNGQRN